LGQPQLKIALIDLHLRSPETVQAVYQTAHGLQPAQSAAQERAN
jgi:hypothetical protein